LFWHGRKKEASTLKKTLLRPRIADNGCGIEAKTLEMIFEPFFTTKEAGKGTGLGLSITQDIIKRHNGEITVDSEFGKGSCFTIKLPVLKEAS